MLLKTFIKGMAYKKRWHKWFAWYPVILSNSISGEQNWVWWEYVWRKQDCHDIGKSSIDYMCWYEYLPIQIPESELLK